MNWRRRLEQAREREEGGFTLIELMIVIVIIPLIVGSIALGLVAVFKIQGGVANRLTASGDTQVFLTTYQHDVDAAQYMTTDPSPPALTVYGGSTPGTCGTGTPLLSLAWQIGSTTTYVASYDLQPSGTTGIDNIVRSLCQNGTLSSTEGLAYHVSPSQAVPSPTCTAGQTCALGGGWVTASAVQQLDLSLLDAGGGSTSASAVLTAAPVSAVNSDPASLGGPTSGPSCGFALPGTGTYASTMCFLNFAGLSNLSNPSNPSNPFNYTPTQIQNGVTISEAIPGGYTLKFSIKVTGTPSWTAHVFPTWTNAFLGNTNSGQPFYTGVGCSTSTPTITTTGYGTPSCISPAIYQTGTAQLQPTTVTINNLTLTAPGGAPATGWEFITADAETTDAGESISWTVNSPLTFSDIPNTPTSPWGNACQNSDGSYGITPYTFQQGTPSSSVLCTDNYSVSTPRTGTLMLGVRPGTGGISTLTSTLIGSGLEGVAFGLLLP
jgi:prepilin-type N-terminal cleavage/methylation domain-containing protein